MISIIIVHYKAKKELFSCLNSIIASHPKTSYEIIVVDNDEKKTIESELKKRFLQVEYIKSPKNLGYGAGNNLGAKYAHGDYLFFLNPDTHVQKGAIDNLVKFAEKNKKLGVVAPLLLDEDKNPYEFQGTQRLMPSRAIVVYSFFNSWFPHNPISRKFWLKDWDKKHAKEVDVVPGTAFLISKKVFEQVGGFDEKFFLYFEEYDLADRLRELGLKLFIIPDAKISHSWGKSTERSDKNISDIFSQSRYYYFKKHFGTLSAFVVNLLTSFSKADLLFIVIVLFGAFLRFYRIQQNFVFGGEIGDNLLAIKNTVAHGVLPLLGPVTSHPWLYFGPLFYWIFGPVLIFSKFNPFSHAYFGAFFATVVLVLNYFVIRKIFETRVALISSFLIAISPLFLSFSRAARFFSLVIPLDYLFLLFLYLVGQGKKKYLFWLFFVYAVMFSFHFSPLLLLPVIISVLLIKRVKLSVRDLSVSAVGFIIPSLPFIIYDAQHGFSMIKDLTLWIPYRVLGFLGLYHKNTVSAQVIHENAYSIYNYFSDSFITSKFAFLGVVVTLVLAAYVLYKLFIFFKTKRVPYNWLLILLWFVLGIAAVFIHGNPPIHYFVPVLPIPILFLSLLLADLWEKSIGKLFTVVLLVVLFLFNLLFYFSSNWFYSQQSMATMNPYDVPYVVQQDAAQFIIQNSRGGKFVLHRVGPDDQFDNGYEQNYIYLLWWYGNEPVQHARTTYTIVEDANRMKSSAGRIVYNQRGIIIQKNEKE